MRVSSVLTAGLAYGTAVEGLKILMNNDDGFGSGNLRELYKLLKGAGHEVVIVAPATQQSGQGGRSDFSTERNLTSPSQYSIVPAGSPAVGTDPNDSHIWYYNGTPAACTFVALDWVLPRYYPDWNQSPDLFVAGPNYGTNLGPFVYSLSGTVGATYAAVSRSVPGIALSASNSAVPYFNVTNATHPAVMAAQAAFMVVEEFIDNTGAAQRVLPLGYGVNVNIPPLSASEALPEIVKSRLTGEAETDVAVYDEETGTFDWDNVVPKAAGVNACYNGDCGLPGETFVVQGGKISVSVFTIDYDAPSIPYTDMVFEKIEGLTGKKSAPKGYGKKRGLMTGRSLTGRDVNNLLA
ncbi:sure-like protein [Corynespora cassiicola Philippines]|uniref:Sure-like protein n=1 Tax=Corynespora cassiicola Philippines TaxID=1448308 RepID=A0A2T2N2F6_CORCC|nr:sure-like protein [Corynespora cassiicola Philippines]